MDEQTITKRDKSLSLSAMCRNLIRAREMKNANTARDYCFWMHHDTAADLYRERIKDERMIEITFVYGLPVYLDSKMEYGEICCVRKSHET